MKTHTRFLSRFALPVLLLLTVTRKLLYVFLHPADAQQASVVQVKPPQASIVTVQDKKGIAANVCVVVLQSVDVFCAL